MIQSSCRFGPMPRSDGARQDTEQQEPCQHEPRLSTQSVPAPQENFRPAFLAQESHRFKKECFALLRIRRANVW
jgi:hypothetical protein